MGGTLKLARSISFVFAVAVIFATTLQTAAADDAAEQKLVIEMFKVMRYDRMIDQMADASNAQIVAMLKKKYPSVEQDALDLIRQVLGEEYRKLLPDMMRFTGVFMFKNFSEDELRTIVAFYKTSAGQKSIDVMPKLMREMLPFVMTSVQQLRAGIMSNLKTRLAEKGYEL